MGLKTFKEIKKNRYELEVNVSAEDFASAIDKVYKKQAAKINVPGFRKGKAPKNFVEKYYGEDIFFEDAVNEVYPKALENALEEAKLEFVNDKIDFDIKEIGKDKGVTFVATVTTKPEVEIKDYKGIEVTLDKNEVTKEQINNRIDEIRKRNSRLVSVDDREAKKDDLAVINFEGFVDDKAFEGGKAENYSLKLGSNQFIPGFEDQIIGHKVSDEFDVNVKFPDDYHAEDLKGKDAVFKCKINELKYEELPELDDEFVKDVSEFDTLDEYKKDIENKLKEENNKKIEESKEAQVAQKLCELLEADIPEAMFENKVQESLNDFKYRLQSQGLKLEDYMKFLNTNLNEIKDKFRDTAQKQVKLQLALEKIAKLEDIKASKEDIDLAIEDLAKLYNIDKEVVKKSVPEKEITKDIINQKALKFVKEAAVVKEKENKEDKEDNKSEDK